MKPPFTSLRERIVVLDSEINEDTAKYTIAQFLFLHREKPGVPITLVIESPGGLIHAALAIHDTMRNLGSPISTVGSGLVGGIALLLLAAGEPGNRFVTPNCTLVISRRADQEQLPVEVSSPLGKLEHEIMNQLMRYVSLSEQDLGLLGTNCLSASDAIRLGLADDVMLIRPS
jgi:ATP-dependent Clp protease protease subunit